MKQRSGMPYDVVAFSTDENAILWTLEEEGAFHRLMRHAWVNGSIPDDVNSLAQIVKCSFEKMSELWVRLQRSWPLNSKGRRTNPKQEQERKYVKAIAKKNSDNANKRWEARNATALPPHSGRNAPLPSPSPPRPNGNEEKKNTGDMGRKTRPPAELPISDSMRLWARENEVTVNLEAETLTMLDHYRGKGETRLDWIATWRTWMRNSKRFAKTGGTNGSQNSAEAKQQRTIEAAQRLRARWGAEDRGGDVGGAFGSDTGGIRGEPDSAHLGSV